MKETASYREHFQEIIKEICPLCGSHTQICIHREKKRYRRAFYHCEHCDLIFVPSQYQVSLEEEKARYDLHQNNPEDEGYIRFLNRLAAPILQKIAPKSCGINFGSGPEPVLSKLIANHGHHICNYDPFYCNTPEQLKKSYDFLISSEVVEHFSTPAKEWKKMMSLLKDGGWMGIMTQLHTPEINFSNWWYKNDETHIAFYSKNTFHWIGKNFGGTLAFIDNAIILFHKH